MFCVVDVAWPWSSWVWFFFLFFSMQMKSHFKVQYKDSAMVKFEVRAVM